MDENLGTPEASQIMRRDGDTLIVVVGEEDADHYSAEGRDGRAGSSGPGQAHGELIAEGA